MYTYDVHVTVFEPELYTFIEPVQAHNALDAIITVFAALKHRYGDAFRACNTHAYLHDNNALTLHADQNRSQKVPAHA
jgi:hypothetical protein